MIGQNVEFSKAIKILSIVMIAVEVVLVDNLQVIQVIRTTINHLRMANVSKITWLDSSSTHHFQKKILILSRVEKWYQNLQQERKLHVCKMNTYLQFLSNTYNGEGIFGFALCTIFTILLILWNSEQKNGLLIKLFMFFIRFWWNLVKL